MICYKYRMSRRRVPPGRAYYSTGMKRLAALLLVLVPLCALAQPGAGRSHGPDRRMEHQIQRPMPAPERRMGWEERERLREQVRSGQMTRDEARQQWHQERARRALEPGRQEERERLRRDVIEANRDLQNR